MSESPEVIVAGHICLDLIPDIPDQGRDSTVVLKPGKLIETGPAVTAVGGVANTGVALHRLGVRTRLMCKVGEDLFGRAILDLLRGMDPALAEGMLRVSNTTSSYTVVVSPPGVDRIFLHCPGANNDFGQEDIAYDRLAGARLFHFGYPTIMKRMYEKGGGETAGLFRRVKAQGLVTSLDMTLPDPNSPAGQVDWRAWLSEVLPGVDIFLPSFDELLFMLNREAFDATQQGPGEVEPTLGMLSELATELLTFGVGVVVIKLGDRGLYLRTSASQTRLSSLEGVVKNTEAWKSRELYAPCFKANVVGTTGSGDSTIAGFMSGLNRGEGPEACLQSATAVGACSVEQADATSGVPNWEVVAARVEAGWERHSPLKELHGNSLWAEGKGCWRRITN